MWTILPVFRSHWQNREPCQLEYQLDTVCCEKGECAGRALLRQKKKIKNQKIKIKSKRKRIISYELHVLVSSVTKSRNGYNNNYHFTRNPRRSMYAFTYCEWVSLQALENETCLCATEVRHRRRCRIRFALYVPK